MGRSHISLPPWAKAISPNMSTVTEFQLLGFWDVAEWQILLFAVFLAIYVLTIAGNAMIVTMVSQARQLHLPMYWLLQHLSVLEVCYTSTIVPRLLVTLISRGQAIAFSACMAQLYFFVCFGATECFLLATMAYDRYLAICSPLRYPFLMSPRVCTKLVATSWLVGAGTGLLPSLMIAQLDFCGPNLIDHFFCDLPPLMQLSCSSIHTTELVIFTLSVAVLCICFSLTLVSYVFIVSSVLRTPSASGRTKAFSTCGSHLTVVSIYYGAMISMYVRPSAHPSPETNKTVSVFYTVVTPLLNPIIYSLRNKDFKEAVRKVAVRKCSFHRVGPDGGAVLGWSGLQRSRW
ncbi:olfactory receptor 11L1 [Ochotona princeps]|uniref:olfactory receptor 11L1 n=1 Tax=Ochotona princeps TaxID=9978 RepID=UPI00271451A3|nr:olfactory receptor 11L1 [Ochotona princeps]